MSGLNLRKALAILCLLFSEEKKSVYDHANITKKY